MESDEHLFVDGTLCDPARVRAVLGRPCLPPYPARLPDYGHRAGRLAPPWCAPTSRALLLPGLTTDDIAKRDTREGVGPQFRDGAVRRLDTRERIHNPGTG